MQCPACGTESATVSATCPQCGSGFGASDTSKLDDDLPTFYPADDSTKFTRQQAPAHDSTRPAGMLARDQTFGTRYRIIRLLGEGGMGAVYEASDLELGVPVALKVIRPDITADPMLAQQVERRFKRELLLARQVTHKNVVRIHDLGDVDGTKYISMTFVRGFDLATILTREGTLRVPHALRIIRSIASGLEAAHAAGVVHRDLKPANVMIDAEGEALIMDFGIARSAGVADGITPGAGRQPVASALLEHTMAGAVSGTVPYMAPEQAGGGTVDHRADIYALGLIGYDMLSNSRRTAYVGDALGELQQRTIAAPPPLASVNPTVPAALDRTLMRCLQPRAADRYQTTRELIADLDQLDDEGNLLPVVQRVTRRQLGAVAAGVVVLLGATWWVAQPPPPRVAPAPKLVLIADFDNRTGDAAFRDTLEQAAAVALEGAPFLTTYNRYSARGAVARASLGTSLDANAARLLALREGIKVVITGSIASQPPGYALALEAVDPSNGAVLAQGRASARDQDGVLRAVAAAATRIRSALGDTTPESVQLTEAETFTATSFEAVQAYVRGQEFNAAGKPRDAVRAWEEAVKIDPRFGRAYANMALVYSNLKQEEAARRNYELALKHIDRMTEREKYRNLGVYYLGATKNYAQAVQNFQALVQAYPSDNMGYANLALAYVYMRDLPQAMQNGRKAVEIYPRNLLQRTNYATYSMYAGDFKTAVTEAQSVLQENPSYEWAGQTLALATLAMSDEAGAREAYGRLSRMSRAGASLAALGEADLEMVYGRYPRAIEILRAAVAAEEKEADSANSLALALVALGEAHLASGDARAAGDALRRAAKLADEGVVYLPESVYFPVAHLLLQLGDEKAARAMADRLNALIPAPPRSYALLIEGEIEFRAGRIPQAIDRFIAAQKLHDSWLAHYLLGTAYMRANQFAEALAEWELCLKRRGESTDVFIADTATLRYLPPVYYWLGRSLEAVGAVDGARANYEQYIALRASATPAQRLVTDARERLARLHSLPKAR